MKWGEGERENPTAIQLDLLVQGRDAGNWSTRKLGMPAASETLKGMLISDRENHQLT